MKTVSIIVPIYNVEKYLKRCLDSLVNQTLEDIEIVLVNDASPDNSLTIMKNYQEKYPDKIVIIDSKENNKQGGARNLGIEISTGEYIGFVDSDDWVELNMYEQLYIKAKEEIADIVDCNYVKAWDVNEIISREISNHDQQIGELEINKKKSLVLETGRLWTKIFKRELIIDNNIRFPKGVFYEDNQFMPVVMVHGTKLAKVDKALYNYFVDNNSSTSKKINSYHHFDRLITAENMINEFKTRGIFNVYEEEVVYKFFQLYYINTIIICLTKFKPIEITKLIHIKEYINKNYPEYINNPYYQKESKIYIKALCRLNSTSPYLLAYIYKVGSSILPHTLIKKVVG